MALLVGLESVGDLHTVDAILVRLKIAGRRCFGCALLGGVCARRIGDNFAYVSAVSGVV